MTQFNCNENQTRTFLKNYDRNGLPFFSITHTHCLFFFERKLLLFQCLCPKKVNAIWAHINIPYYTSFNTHQCIRLYRCVCVCAHLFLKLYLYKYHLSVHVHIYLTNSIYLQIGGVQYFLLINRTHIFTYCFYMFIKILTLLNTFSP